MKLVTMSRVQSLRSDTLYDLPHVCVPSVGMIQHLDMLSQEMQCCKISFDCVVMARHPSSFAIFELL